MKPTETRALVEGALLSAITIILSLVALYIPVIGVFATLIWPVPIIILGIRHGPRTSILATIVAGAVVAMFEGPVQSFIIMFGFGLIGVSMGIAIRKNLAPLKVLAIGSVASIISKFILVIISLKVMGINPITQEIAIMRESLSAVNNLYNSLGVSPDNVKSITENLSGMIDMMVVIIPAILLLASVVDAFLNYIFTKIILSRLGQKIEDLTPFWLWKMPTYTVFLFLVGTLLLMMKSYWQIEILETIGLNLQMIFYFAFLIQGFSLITYFMGKYNVPRMLRVVFVFMVFLTPVIAQILSWAGMFDILFNFRKI